MAVMVTARPAALRHLRCHHRQQYSPCAVLLAAAALYQQGGVMSDWATWHALLSSVMYYASPLLMLAGIAGFATCMAMWVIRK